MNKPILYTVQHDRFGKWTDVGPVFSKAESAMDSLAFWRKRGIKGRAYRVREFLAGPSMGTLEVWL